MGEKKLLTAQELLKATNATLFNNKVSLAMSCSSVVTDSRNVKKNSLFVALIGNLQDGHDFIESAVKNGASIILVQKSSLSSHEIIYSNIHQDIVILLVEDTLKALQDAASYYLRKFDSLIKIAVTGSNGKTTAKECIASVLAKKYSVVMNVGNLNSETGLPLSMFTIDESHEVGIFEMGMNRRGEINELADVFFPNLAVITNIGTAHIGILGTQQAIAEEKKQIFSNFTSDCVGFVYEGEKYYDFLTKDVEGTIKPYGVNALDSVKQITANGLDGSSILRNSHLISFPLIGTHNIQNALAAIAIAEHLGLSDEQIQQGLESVKPLFGRSEVLRGDITIIQDCYNGSYESTSASLDFFSDLEWAGRKIVILGDMLELGEKSLDIHVSIIKKVLESNFSKALFIGTSFTGALKKENIFQEGLSTDDISDIGLERIVKSLIGEIDSNDIILLKGSRGIQLERCTPILKNIVSCKEVD